MPEIGQIDPNVQITDLKTGQLTKQGFQILSAATSFQLPRYTVTTLPSASLPGKLIYVSNGTSNKRLAVSDGTSWRFPDGAVVS